MVDASVGRLCPYNRAMPDPATCRECGAQLELDARFCQNCGAAVPGHVAIEGGYPVHLLVSRADRYPRMSTLVRWVLAIPHMIWFTGYTIAAAFVTLYVWFAILGSSRYPQNSFEWMERYLRYSTRVLAYLMLIGRTFPPFHGRVEEGADTDSRFSLDRPEELNRLTTALRLPSVIASVLQEVNQAFVIVTAFLWPAQLIAALLGLAAFFIGIAAWVAILITGRFPAPLFRVVELAFRYTIRLSAFQALVTDTYPFFQPEGTPKDDDVTTVYRPDWS